MGLPRNPRSDTTAVTLNYGAPHNSAPTCDDTLSIQFATAPPILISTDSLLKVIQ